MHAESGDETIEDELEEPRYQEEFNRVLEEHPLLFNSSPPFLQRLRTCHDSAQPLSPCSARLSAGLYPEESNPVNRLTASSAPRRVRISLWMRTRLRNQWAAGPSGPVPLPGRYTRDRPPS